MDETETTYKDQFGNTHQIDADDSSPLCILCNIDEKDTFENPDSMLCISCRENSIRYPMPKWLIAVIAIVVIILAFALFKTPTVMNDFKIYKDAEASYNQMNYNTAANGYSLIGERYKTGLRINERMFLALMKAQRFEEATLIFDDRLAGKNASDETFDEIASYSNLLSKYYITMNKIDVIYADETIKNDSAKVYAGMEALLTDEECDSSLLLFNLAQINIGRDQPTLAIKQLTEACNAEPRSTFITSYLGDLQRRRGMYDDAITSYNSALTVNKDDESAYRGLGVVSLLKGEFDKGLELTKKAYDLNKNARFVIDTYVVALQANGKTEQAKTLYEEMKNSTDYLFDQEMDDYLAGKTTLEKIYKD